MKIKKLFHSSWYKKSFRGLPVNTQMVAARRLQLFQKDPFNSQLKTHKLSGKLENYWSFSVDYQTRIMFEFVDENSVGLIDIGPHKIYKQ